MLSSAIKAEVAQWIGEHEHLRDERGHRQVVRNGYLPERSITTGIGPMKVRQPRVHDRRKDEEAEPFSSKILPPYLRKTRSIEELLPWLYLKGISTGDFNEAASSVGGPRVSRPVGLDRDPALGRLASRIQGVVETILER